VKAKDENAPVRILKDATRIDHAYRTKHPVKTLTVGSVKASVSRNGTLLARDVEAVSQQLRLAVIILNRLRHYTYWAMVLDITRILEQPGPPESRKAALDEVLDGDGYSKRLATMLLTGEMSQNTDYARACKRGEHPEKPHAIVAYEHFKDTTGLSAVKNGTVTLEDTSNLVPQGLTLTRASEMLMVQVQTSLRTHYRNASVRLSIHGFNTYYMVGAIVLTFLTHIFVSSESRTTIVKRKVRWSFSSSRISRTSIQTFPRQAGRHNQCSSPSMVSWTSSGQMRRPKRY
jgi:hypothetical protein